VVFDGRYIADEPKFKRYAYAALKSRFPDEPEFENFYTSLDTPELKDEFLHVAAFYLFLVKQGEWHVTIEGSAPVVDYLSTSFKVTALFALIESLSDEHHQDFYEWLYSREAETTFPIGDLAALRKLYKDYKNSYGSIRRCVAFFSRLSPEHQQTLCSSIKKDKKPLASIKKVAEFLYKKRSEFVHEARFVLSLVYHTALSIDGEKIVEKLPPETSLDDFVEASHTTLLRDGKKVLRVNLSLETLLDAFEEGVLAYFSDRRSSARPTKIPI
jgi:hypothetical protein